MSKASSEKTSNRRRSARHKLNAPAQLYTSAGAVAGHLVDLSEEGARISLEEDFGIPVECIVRIPFGQDPEEAITLLAVTCHINKTEVGLRWLKRPDTETLIKIERLISPGLGLLVVLAPIPKLVWPTS